MELIKPMRWKVFCYNNKENNSENCTEHTFRGIKSKKFPPKIKDLEDFESDLLKLMHKIKFRKYFYASQQKLKKNRQPSHRKFLENSTFSDKTKNLYLVDINMYAQFLHNKITITYTKARTQMYNDVNQETNYIARLK